MSTSVEVNERFCGPPTSGNGGYVSGLIASFVGSSAKVRLTAPPPLNEPLHIHKSTDHVELRNNEDVIGVGSKQEFTLELPPTPSLTDAEQAQNRFIAFNDHVFPCCFVCGPDRDKGDGLRIFPGPVIDDDWSVLACTWKPSADLYGEDGRLQHEFIWAALDCPSYFGALGNSMRVALLGEMELNVVSEVTEKGPLIIWCWPISSEGRKHYGGSAVATVDGKLIAYARGLWIELKKQAV